LGTLLHFGSGTQSLEHSEETRRVPGTIPQAPVFLPIALEGKRPDDSGSTLGAPDVAEEEFTAEVSSRCRARLARPV